MRGLALRLFSRSRSRTKGKVVLIPDFMGTALSRIDWEGTEESTPIWMNIAALMAGQFDCSGSATTGFRERIVASISSRPGYSSGTMAS